MAYLAASSTGFAAFARILARICRHAQPLSFTYLIMAESAEYSPSDFDMSLAAPERQGYFRYFRSSEVAHRHGGGVASGSHVKARQLTRDYKHSVAHVHGIVFNRCAQYTASGGKGYRMILKDTRLADGPDYRKRADTPWDKNIDAQSRWKKSRTAAGAYESNNAIVDRRRGQPREYQPYAHGRTSDTDSTAYELVQDETTGSDVAISPNMRTVDSLGAIVRLFASAWLPPEVYAQLREASRNFRCRCDAESLHLIHSFTEAFLRIRDGPEPKWNTQLKDSLSELHTHRLAYANDYTRLSKEETSQVIWNFASDFLLSAYQNLLPTRKKPSIVNHILRKEMGCQFRVRAIIQEGLIAFSSAHAAKDVLQVFLQYIRNIEEIVASLKRQVHLREKVWQGSKWQLSKRHDAKPWVKGIASRPKRLTQPWLGPSKPAQGIIRAHRRNAITNEPIFDVTPEEAAKRIM